MLSQGSAHRVGVCSWSLRPMSGADLAAKVKALGLGAVQLALDPIRAGGPGWGEIETANALRSAGISVLSGMMGMVGEDYTTLESIKRTGGVRPDSTWGENLRAAESTAKLARRLGINLVTFHAGFIPHAGAGEGGSGGERRTLIARLRTMVDRFDDHGVRVGLETGQESAETLLEALHELNRPHVGVNFDPANMILYGMGGPVAAMERLASRIVQIHIKDAVATREPGTWGTEVRAGAGDVNWLTFFAAVRAKGLGVDLLIEREGGAAIDARSRREDIAAAKDLLGRHGFGGTGAGGPWHE